MPSIWSRSAQKISERISGPRTKDLEFDSKAEQTLALEQQILGLRIYLKHFQLYIGSLTKLNKDVGSMLSLLATQKFSSAVGEGLIKLHLTAEGYFSEFTKNAEILWKYTSEWLNEMDEVKKLLESREGTRLEYDHYETKLEKIKRNRSDKLAKGEEITEKDNEYHTRVS